MRKVKKGEDLNYAFELFILLHDVIFDDKTGYYNTPYSRNIVVFAGRVID